MRRDIGRDPGQQDVLEDPLPENLDRDQARQAVTGSAVERGPHHCRVCDCHPQGRIARSYRFELLQFGTTDVLDIGEGEASRVALGEVEF